MALKRFISVAVPRDFTVEVNATLDRLFGRLFNGGTLSQRDYAEVAAVFASSHGCNTHENRFRETAGCLFLAVNRNFTVLYPPPDRVQNPNDGALDELSLALNHFFEASSLVKAQPSQMIKSLDAKVHLMIAVPLFIDREYRQVNDLLVPVVRRLPGTEAWEFGVIQYLQILSQAKFVLTHISPSDKKRQKADLADIALVKTGMVLVIGSVAARMEGTNKPVKPVFRLTEPVFGPNTYLWIAVDYYITVMRLLFSESELKGRFDKFHLNNDRGAEIIRLGNSVFSLVENNLQGNRAVGPQDINETLKTVYFRSESDCDAFWRVLKSAYMAVSDPAGLIDTYSKWLPDTHDTVLKKVDAAFVISREDIRAPSLVSGLMAGLRTADICKFKSSALMAQFYVRLRMALQDGNGGHIDDAVREFGRWMTVSHASGIPFTPGNDPYLMPCGDLVASSEILFRPACAPFSAPKVQCACCNKEFKRSALISFSDHNDVMSRWVSHVVTPDGVGADAGYRFVGVPILFLPDNVLREKMAVPTFLFQIVSALRTVPEQDPLTWVSVRKSAVLQLVSGQFETQWMIKPQRVVRFLEGLESDDFKFLWHHILSDDGRLSCFRFAVVLNSERLLSRCHAELPLTPEVYDTVTDSRAGRNTLHHYLFSGFSSSDTQLLQWLRLFFFLVDLGFKPNSANRENELPLDRTLPIFRITLLHRLTESRLPGSGRIEPIQSELLPKPVQKLHAIRQNRMFDVTSNVSGHPHPSMVGFFTDILDAIIKIPGPIEGVSFEDLDFIEQSLLGLKEAHPGKTDEPERLFVQLLMRLFPDNAQGLIENKRYRLANLRLNCGDVLLSLSPAVQDDVETVLATAWPAIFSASDTFESAWNPDLEKLIKTAVIYFPNRLESTHWQYIRSLKFEPALALIREALLARFARVPFRQTEEFADLPVGLISPSHWVTFLKSGQLNPTQFAYLAETPTLLEAVLTAALSERRLPERAIADVFKNIDFESLRRPFFNALVAVNLDALWRYAASEYGKVLVSEFPAVWESMSHADELPNWVSHLTPQMWNDAETEFHLLHGAIDKGPDALWRIEFLRDHLSVFTLVRNLYPGEYIRTHPLWAAANVSVRGRGPVTVVRPRSPLDSALDLFGEIRARVWQTILKELNQFVASYSGSAVDEVVEKLDLWVRQMESDREVWNALANAVKARTLRNSVWLRLMASKEKWEQLRTVLSPQWLDPLFFEQVETSAVYSLCTTSARADQYWLSVFSQLECSDEFTQPCIGGQSPLSVYLAAGIETREDLGRRLVSGGTVKRLPVSTLAGYAAVAVCPDEKTWTYELVGKEDVGLIRMMLDLFPDSVYSGLEARQTPLHRCCELAQTIILGRTPQYQRLDRLSEIFDAIRERLCAGGRGTAQQFQLTPEALDLIQSVSDFLSEILAGMPTSIHSNFVSYIDNWKAALDRDRFRETFQFHIETDMTLSPPVLAGLLGDSFLSIHTQNICQDPKIYKTIFSKFLAFVDDQMRQNPSPLADFEFRSETLACVGFLLNQYEKSVDKIERLQLDSLFEVAAVWARESPKKLVVKLVSPSRSQSMRHKVHGLVDSRESTVLQHPFFADPTRANWECLLKAVNKSETELLGDLDVMEAMRASGVITEREAAYLADTWRELSDGHPVVTPVGFWGSEQGAEYASQSAALVIPELLASGRTVPFRLVHLDSGPGADYHAGVNVSETVDYDSGRLTVSSKVKRVPYLAVNLHPQSFELPPAWFRAIHEARFNPRAGGNSPYIPAHVMEAVVPTVGGAVEVWGDSDIEVRSKTQDRGPTSAFQTIKNLVFISFMEPEWFGFVEGVDATFRKQGYKRLMMLFDLWLGAQIVDYIEKLNGHADPVHVTLVLEAGHKIASDCMKQLGGSADHSPDKMLIIAQAEKLTTKLDQCLAPMRGGVAVGSRLPARLDQPLFPFMPLKVHAPIFSSASGSVEPGLPLYSKRRILDWAGIVEVLADTLSWFADLENRASEVRISAATARVEDFALSYLNARDGLASDSVSESVLGSLVKAADSVIKEYLKVCLHREAIRKEVQDPFEYGRRLITAIALFDLVDRAVRANPVIGLVFGNYYFPLVGAINGSAITALTHLILPGSLWQRAAKQVLDIVQENSTGRTALTRTDFSLGILQFVIRRDGDYPPLFERLEFLADSVPEWKEKLADRGPEVLTNIAFRYQELLRAHPAPMIREWMRAVQHAVIVIHNIPSNGTGVNKMHPFEWHTNVNDTQHSVYISGALASVGSRPQPSFLHFVSVNYQKFLNLESVSENKRLTENAVIPSEIGVSAFHHIGLLFSDPVDQRMERLYSHIQDGVFNLEDPHHQYLIRQVLWMANAAEPNAFSRMLTDRPGLYAGFCDLFLACFRKLEMKMMSVNAVAFLAETASVFREFSDPADQGPWTALMGEIRDWILRQVSSKQGAAKTHSAAFLVDLILSFRYQSVMTLHEAEQLILGISLLKRELVIGQPIAYIGTMPVAQHSKDAQSRWYEIFDVMNRHLPALEQLVSENPAVLTSIVSRRVIRLAGAGEKAWTRDPASNLWTYDRYAFSLLDGMLYEDGYPVGELSEEIQAHPDFAYYLGPANRFETVRDSYGQYKSVGLEQEMTFRLIDKPKPFPNQNRIEYRGMTFSPVTDWTSHFVPIDRICQRLEVLSGDQDKRYTVYFSHPRHFLICAQHLAYRIQVDDDPEWFDIWQIRTWGGAYYETAVSLSDLKRFKGLPSSSELRHRNGKPVYGTLVDHPGNKDLVIERQTGSRVEMAVPKWLIQTQFPAFIYGGNRKERIVFWALMTDTYPRTDLTINVAVDGTEETLYWLDRDGEDIRVFSPDRLIRYHNVMDTDLAPEWIRLTQFEDPNYIVFETEAMADGGPGPARISFPRLALTFDYKHTNWISREVDGFQIAPNQTLFIWGEFRHYLVLIPVNTVLSEADLESGMPYAGVPFKILVPHISIGQSDGTQRLYHARLSCDPTIVFGPQAYLVTSYDPITRRFSTETTLETLNLALLFLLNASLDKSPYTGMNDYEMAAQCLKSCRQNRPYDANEVRILDQIISSKDPHRNASAVRLLAMSLQVGSTALPSFYPDTKRVPAIAAADDYRAYLQKSGRVAGECQLPPEQLFNVVQPVLVPKRSIDALDRQLIGQISETSFSEMLSKIFSISVRPISVFPGGRLKISDSRGDLAAFLIVLVKAMVDGSIPKPEMHYILRRWAIAPDHNPLLLKVLMIINENSNHISEDSIGFLSDFIGTSKTFYPGNGFFKESYIHSSIPDRIKTAEGAVQELTNWLDSVSEIKRSIFGEGRVVTRTDFAEMCGGLFERQLFESMSAGERLSFENSFQSLAIQYKSNFRAGLFLMDLGQICDEKKAIFPANYWAEYGRPPKPQAPYAHRITSRTLLDSAAARVRPIPPGPIRLSLTQTIIGILRRFGVESEVAIPVGAKDVDEAVFKEVIDRLSEQFDLDHTDRLVTVLRTVRPKIAFPLVAYRGPDGSLLRERYQRLEASWAAYQDIPIETYALETAKGEEESKKIEVLEQQLILRLDRWSAAAKLLQQWVESVANKLPEDSQGWRFHVDRMRGMGQLSASDTLALLIDQSILDKRNPFLNEIKSLLVTAVTLFAQAQTYYQHLARCASLVRSAKMFADQPEKSKLIVQQIGGVLAEHRVFTAAEDPAALLFELENNLRIRPGQYALAQLMIRGSRQIAQMNMGEGKSTVIMMLIVIGHALKGNLTRIIVPDALMAEMRRNLKKIGPIFKMLVYFFPFHRDVKSEITIPELEELLRQVRHSHDHKKVILMTPEQRESLRLTIIEIKMELERLSAENSDFSLMERRLTILKEVERIVDIDMLDEVDFILRLTTELNFTIGSQGAINGAPIRMNVALEFARLILFDLDIRDVISRIDGIILTENRVEFRDKMVFSDSIRRVLADRLIERFFPDLPREAKAQMVEIVMASGPLGDTIGSYPLNPRDKDVLRTLRCWMSPTISGYVFGQQHGVHYDLVPEEMLDKVQPHQRYSAIPYKGRNSPMPTSSFEHPDVRIGFTILSYFYKGLSEREMKEVLVHLSQNHYTRQATFDSWIRKVDGPVGRVASWDALHIADPSHIEMVTRMLSRSVDAISYFLEYIVFARTFDFPHKIGADGSTICLRDFNGFSGTTTMALPKGAAINAVVPDEEINREFLATDGKMLARVIDKKVFSVRRCPDTTEALLKALVDRMADSARPIQALLDPGSLIAGMLNHEVAESLMRRISAHSVLRSKYLGVVYFDDRNGIVMVARMYNGRISKVPLSSCRIKKKYLLTYFNDIYTRGINRVFSRLAMAVQTVGRKMRVEDLVQAAMRMRQLGKGQTVELWIPTEVEKAIRAFMRRSGVSTAGDITPLDIYAWAVSNSTEQEVTALMGQERRHQRAVAAEAILYPGPMEMPKPADTLLEPSSLPLSTYDYAVDHAVGARVQIEQQAEVRTESENQAITMDVVQLDSLSSTAEESWNYSEVLNPGWIDRRQAFGTVRTTFMKSKSLAALLLENPTVLSPDHCLNRIYVSQNFWRVLRSSDPIHSRLRPVEAYLEVKSSDGDQALNVVVLSGCESEKIKQVLLSEEGKACRNWVALRQLSDPVGKTEIRTPGVDDGFNGSQQLFLVMASLLNGDSGLFCSVVGPVLADSEAGTMARFSDIVRELAESLPPAERARFFVTLKLIRESRFKSHQYFGSPLEMVEKGFM